jgi:predicted dehydrogenase
MIVPPHVLGQTAQRRAPSDTLNVAIVGMGQQGVENGQDLVEENIVAICDVDMRRTEERVDDRTRNRDGTPRENGVRLQEMLQNAARYTDFRRMLEEQTDIDAVLIATPDHLHAIIAKTAMELGKHVYVQKPLTYSVHEARLLARVANETKVATQMGNQGHSREGTRRINDWIRAGVIGPVREVHV